MTCAPSRMLISAPGISARPSVQKTPPSTGYVRSRCSWTAQKSVAWKCSVSARPSSPTRRAMRTMRSTDTGSNLKCLDIFGCEWVSIRFKPFASSRSSSTIVHSHPQCKTTTNPKRSGRACEHRPSVPNILLLAYYRTANSVLLGIDGGLPCGQCGLVKSSRGCWVGLRGAEAPGDPLTAEVGRQAVEHEQAVGNRDEPIGEAGRFGRRAGAGQNRQPLAMGERLQQGAHGRGLGAIESPIDLPRDQNFGGAHDRAAVQRPPPQNRRGAQPRFFRATQYPDLHAFLASQRGEQSIGVRRVSYRRGRHREDTRRAAVPYLGQKTADGLQGLLDGRAREQAATVAGESGLDALLTQDAEIDARSHRGENEPDRVRAEVEHREPLRHGRSIESGQGSVKLRDCYGDLSHAACWRRRGPRPCSTRRGSDS